MEARFVAGNPLMVDYTPSGAPVALGEVVVVGDTVLVCHRPIADGALGAVAACGGVYEMTAGEAIAAGKKVYFNTTTNKLVETASGNKLFGFLPPDESASADGDTVRAVHMPDLSASTYAAVVAALTDNSGGAAADGTIGVVTAPTALTDNGGGTADGTVASLAPATTLTDSTGLSGSHDDTLAATSVPADLTGGEDPTEAEHNALLAVVRVMAQNDSDLAQKVIELVTFQGVVQDDFKELTTAQGQNRTAIVALTDAVAELATKTNAILTALKNAGLMATS